MQGEGPAVVLLSGGLDSTTVVAMARAAGRSLYALSFRYGQRHAIELASAARQARRVGVVRHEVIDLSHLGPLVAGATALVAQSDLEVPREREIDDSIPVTYVPARNTLFLSYALAWAEALAARELWLGVNAIDYSGYPDCRPEFLDAFARMANLATKAGVEGRPFSLRAPLLHMTKAEIIRAGVALGVDYADTVSCYDPRVDGELPLACGRCDSCALRREGFVSAGVPDPTRYQASP
ncbi:MAG: 7-cyano-7-deazaguanine synthase QueC [Myxococcales bacterium]|nr:7-cyano-7-deazaguanine synthase QueC [Myxococcales bacterium]